MSEALEPDAIIQPRANSEEPNWSDFKIDLEWDSPGEEQDKLRAFMHAFIDWRVAVRRKAQEATVAKEPVTPQPVTSVPNTEERRPQSRRKASRKKGPRSK